MNLLFTICARAGSKGVKNKNVRLFNNIPLVYYTIAAYNAFAEANEKKYGVIDLSVNTDSSVLVSQIKETGVKFTHIERKTELAGDFVSKMDVIRNTAIEMECKTQKQYDIIIDLDLTSPLRRDTDIEGVLNCLLMNNLVEGSFSVVPSRRLPFFNMVMEKPNGSFGLVIDSDYVSRQQAPKCYDMNASIYAYKRAFLLNSENGSILDGEVEIYEMRDTGIIDIDNEEDLELMEHIAKFYDDILIINKQ